MLMLPIKPMNGRIDFVILGINFLNKIAESAGMKRIFDKNKVISNTEISSEMPNKSFVKNGIVKGIKEEVITTNTVDHKIFRFKKLAKRGVIMAPETANNRKNPMRIS